VLRTPNDTIAGGVIADAAPKRHRRGDADALAALEVLLSGSARHMVAAALARAPFSDAAALGAGLGLPRDEIDAALRDLAASGEVVLAGERDGARAVPATRIARMRSDAAALLDAYHHEHPLRAGMPQEELRSRLGLESGALSAVSKLLPDVRLTGATAALANFRPQPTPAQQEQIDAWLASLRASPGGADAAVDPALQAYAIDAGLVVDAGGSVLFERTAFDEMAARVRAHIERRGAITLAEARDLFGTSRKHAQALLEQLDRLRVTRRVEDRRVLR
jgi:selenocysteine-specific elongation factor